MKVIYKPKPRIVVIGLKGLPAFGGAATVGENIINQLKDDYDFTVLSISSHTSKEFAIVNGVKQVIFRNYGSGSFNTLVYFLKCLVHVWFNKYDLVYLHHAESGFITPFLRLRCKVVVTFHGVQMIDQDPKFSQIHNWFFRFSQRLNIRWANMIVSVSKPHKDYIYKKYNRVIEYIPNGMSPQFNNPKVENKKNTKEYIFFSAARIYQIKGLHLLLKAAKKIVPPVKLIVAGDLDQVTNYKNEINDLTKGINVEYLGLIRDKAYLMSKINEATLFIFPSLTEAMSMMLLEAVSTMTPVIASDIPSNKAVFTDNELLFFKNNDSEDLALKLQNALDNPDIMANKAKAAFEKLSKDYTWQSIAQQYSKIFKKMLS